jgi:MFS family permease
LRARKRARPPPNPDRREPPLARGARTFALLYFFESLARTSLVTVLPLTAYGLFGGKEAVSLLYTVVSPTTLGFSFASPAIVGRLSRRWAYPAASCSASSQPSGRCRSCARSGPGRK